MAFNINQFRDHFAKHDDFAKTSKFDVRITAPTRLDLDATDLRFQCETTELPGYTVNTVDGRYYGVASPVASFPTFGDLTLTFICSGDFWEKKLFDKWLNLVIPFNTSYNPTLTTGSLGFVYESSSIWITSSTIPYNYSGTYYTYPDNQLKDFATASYFTPYVGSLGFYNDSNQLLAVAKMSQPVPLSNATDLTFLVKLDW